MTENKTIVFEHVNCDLCGCGEYTVRYRKPDDWSWLNQFEFPVVECTRCGLVYVNPRPTAESMAYYYPEGYHDKRDTEAFQKRYALQLEFLPALTGEKVLDIGCARGEWLHFLKNKYPGIAGYGVDYYSESVLYKDIDFRKKRLPDCDFKDSFFDLVTAWAVLEHLHAPGSYFREVSRILKKGGTFFFLVTNSESLYGKKAYKEDVPRHLYHFSEKTLQQYAGRYGFDFSNCVYDNRIWDGRGGGTFYYALLSLFGVNWETIYFKKIGLFRTQIGRVGRFIDRVVFKTQWEARRHSSGVIICEFVKK